MVFQYLTTRTVRRFLFLSYMTYIDNHGDEYPLLNEFIHNPYFIYLDKNGGVLSIRDCAGYLLPIQFMQAVMAYATEFLSTYKSNEDIAMQNSIIQAIIGQEENVRDRKLDKRDLEYTIKKSERHIYLIRDIARGLYKIGSAKNVETRFKQLKTANAEIELVCSYFCHLSDERELHEVLSGVRVSGEWFVGDGHVYDVFHDYFSKKGLIPTIYN